ncbi:MAG: gliding motility-associated ABC transporter ATP-binding subunit GldA, partial [Bacteroidota bacterium]
QQSVLVEFSGKVSRTDLLALDGVEGATNVQGNSWRLLAPEDREIRDALFRFAVDRELTVLTLQKEEQRLEDVFKRLTAK